MAVGVIQDAAVVQAEVSTLHFEDDGAVNVSDEEIAVGESDELPDHGEIRHIGDAEGGADNRHRLAHRRVAQLRRDHQRIRASHPRNTENAVGLPISWGPTGRPLTIFPIRLGITKYRVARGGTRTLNSNE